MLQELKILQQLGFSAFDIDIAPNYPFTLSNVLFFHFFAVNNVFVCFQIGDLKTALSS